MRRSVPVGGTTIVVQADDARVVEEAVEFLRLRTECTLLELTSWLKERGYAARATLEPLNVR